MSDEESIDWQILLMNTKTILFIKLVFLSIIWKFLLKKEYKVFD